MSDDLPPGYHGYDVKTVDAVTVIDGAKAAIWMTDAGGLKVCVFIQLADLFGAAAQIAAHVAPREVPEKAPLPLVN